MLLQKKLFQFLPKMYFFFTLLFVAKPLQYENTASGFDVLIRTKNKRMN